MAEGHHGHRRGARPWCAPAWWDSPRVACVRSQRLGFLSATRLCAGFMLTGTEIRTTYVTYDEAGKTEVISGVCWHPLSGSHMTAPPVGLDAAQDILENPAFAVAGAVSECMPMPVLPQA